MPAGEQRMVARWRRRPVLGGVAVAALALAAPSGAAARSAAAPAGGAIVRDTADGAPSDPRATMAVEGRITRVTRTVGGRRQYLLRLARGAGEHGSRYAVRITRGGRTFAVGTVRDRTLRLTGHRSAPQPAGVFRLRPARGATAIPVVRTIDVTGVDRPVGRCVSGDPDRATTRGTWGTGIFDNDTAADWASEVVEQNSAAFVRRTLAAAAEAPLTTYLDSWVGEEALAAGEIVAAAAGHPMAADAYQEDALRWARRHPEVGTQAFRDLATIAATRVCDPDSSDLPGLWEDDAEWRASIVALLQRLAAAG